MIPQDQSRANWCESIEKNVIFFSHLPNLTMVQAYQLAVSVAQKSCQKVDTKIIQQTPTSLFYQLNVVGCGSDGDQGQYGKIFHGTDAIYSVRYSAMANQVSDMEVTNMRQSIQSSSLMAK